MVKFETHLRESPIVCAEAPPDPCTLVIFGASGDLTYRKLIPAIFNLFKRGLLPDPFDVIGFARMPMTSEEFRHKACDAIGLSCADAASDDIQRFAHRFDYLQGDYDDELAYKNLAQKLTQNAAGRGTPGANIFYLALPPEVFPSIVAQLGRTGLVSPCAAMPACARVVVEKPFGSDLATARELDRKLREHLAEDQIYRIDHYLGKETVQNLFMFRFANAIFEPLWNHQYIDHVQITVAEAEGVGHRSRYYEGSGLLRDMFQNHLLQMLAIIAMEPPASFDAERVRDERVKLLRAIRPIVQQNTELPIVRGQYARGRVGDEDAKAYREEEGAAHDSDVETFAAAELWIDNWRWQGVPFYLRSGKRLSHRCSEIALTFKHVPHSMFELMVPQDLAANELVFTVQPDEGISLSILAKGPGAKLCISRLAMDFRYREAFGADLPDAYERLLLDCMRGDQTLFIRSDALEAAWALIDPVREAWAGGDAPPLVSYEAGTAGPAEADRLIERGGRKWRPL